MMWMPSAASLPKLRIQEFTRFAAQRHAKTFNNYGELHTWSVEESPAFWGTLWDFCDVIGSQGSKVVTDREKLPGANWFPEGELNFAENLLRHRDDRPAIIFRREDGIRQAWNFSQLYDQVARLQFAFRQAGLQTGDRVAAFIPNSPEAIFAMLAVSSLGGIWSSCSPDFGVEGVIDRFGQIEPKFFVAANGYSYKGKPFSSMQKLAEIQQRLPTLQQTIVFSYVDVETNLSTLRNSTHWDTFLAAAPKNVECEFQSFPFNQPLYILFSSGTTGKPKCIVHGAGGTLLQHLKEHQLHTNISLSDRLFYFTTTGWMMWNWLVTGLATGATVILYDGNPFHPGPEALWDMAQEEKITVFGTSAKYIDAVKKVGLLPKRTHDLNSLRAILSTGSPLVPESFDFVYQEVKPDLQLASISGGTDIVSCFVLGNPALPVHRGQIQCSGLGMKVEVFDESGKSVENQPGELICSASFPSMPVGFWNDPDGKKYRAAYFDQYPNIWRHGDWVQQTPEGGLIIFGRSDATLNPGGVRIGTAEIYRQVEQLRDIEEGIVIGQSTPDGDQRIVLFVKLVGGKRLTDGLCQIIRKEIRAHTTPRHVPAVILEVQDIPRTRSGKISEIAVRDVVHGRSVKNTEALANPEALNEYHNRPELSF